METATPLSTHPLSTYIASAIFTAVALIVVSFWSRTEKPFKGLELAIGPEDGVSSSDAEKAYGVKGPTILEAGTQKFRRKAFQVYGESGPIIVLPSTQYFAEVKSDPRFDSHQANRKVFMIDFPGFEGLLAVTHDKLLGEVIRSNLKSGLAHLNEDLLEEIDNAAGAVLGDPSDWTSIGMLYPCYHMVARVSTRLFLGLPLCRDPRWLDIAVQYTAELFEGTRTLRFWPERLRPLAHWFLPQCRKLRATVRRAREVLTPGITQLRREWEERQRAGDKAPSNNIIHMMLDMATKKGYPIDDIDFVVSELGLTAAAMHTTTDMVMQTLFDICCHPEYLEPLRAEIDELLAANGGVLGKTTKLSSLRFMDSFMKEVQRMKPATLTGSKRVTTEDVRLADGTFLAKGSYVALYNNARTDGTFYPDPERFDPYRSMRAREEPGKENMHQFVSTSPESVGFGHGMHACPGRFIASNEIKLILCVLLTRYDWRLPDGASKPQPISVGAELLADPVAHLMYKKRSFQECDV
ncbi:ACC synthase [Macrophomina phaseolina MS6]|uniref:ACC synthase n=1 Tax=Macrophomina phaseolina (strain MS6) TaxID=1126212 RepID=K2S3P4_MACPH|nr:ACC synthase [Macrophomina phaseolina MS6]